MKSGLMPPSCEALNAIAANPSIPITPLTTRIIGEILSRLLMSVTKVTIIFDQKLTSSRARLSVPSNDQAQRRLVRRPIVLAELSF